MSTEGKRSDRQDTLDNALISFDKACTRWRKLYQDAVRQLQLSREVIDRSATGSTTQEERKNAETLEREGKHQSQLEFYPYRYFASEGFLPGYNFPRLPVRAYTPAGDEGEFISRPRVVAIREFAPQNIVYYDDSKIMELTYGDTADVWRINRGLKNSQERAIQGVYKLEENELASERLGQGQYILFWEASEGGAGVLSQILEDKNALQKLASEALDICHFTQPKESCSQACYECLLSYRNQFDHPLLNRNLIRPYLERLTNSNIDRHSQGNSREAQYQKLLAQTDPNSDFEREFLAELYQQGIKLPDSAQMLIPEVNVKPDFVYTDAKVAIFCDGSIHDHPEQQESDRIQRENLKYTNIFYVLIFRYDEDWRSQLNILNSF